MLRILLRLLQFCWKRIGDLALVQWLFPSSWFFVISLVGAVASAAIGIARGLPSYFWLPFALAVLVLILLAAHLAITLKERLIPPKTSRPELFRTRSIYDANATVVPTPACDMPIWQAIMHVRTALNDTDNKEFWPVARKAIRQAALDGKIKLRGRKQIDTGEMRTVFSEVYTDIPSEYWKTSKLNVLATEQHYATWDHIDPETARAWGPRGVLEKNRYAGLLVNADEIKREWPTRLVEIQKSVSD